MMQHGPAKILEIFWNSLLNLARHKQLRFINCLIPTKTLFVFCPFVLFFFLSFLAILLHFTFLSIFSESSLSLYSFLCAFCLSVSLSVCLCLSSIFISVRTLSFCYLCSHTLFFLSLCLLLCFSHFPFILLFDSLFVCLCFSLFF